jgi:hypothetical protein
VNIEIPNRDALQLGNPAKLRWRPEARSRTAKHDHPAVIEQQLTVPDGSVMPFIPQSLGEAENADEPVHGGPCVLIQQVRNHLWV